MERMSAQGIYILTSRAQSQLKKIDAAAVNVANVNTPGFKRQDVDFATTLGQHRSHNGRSNSTQFVNSRGFRNTFSQGAITQTGNPLDAAIIGEGFFAVQSRTHGITYTRNGQFTVAFDGTLVNQQGEAILSDANVPITIPRNATVSITRDGGIIADDAQIAQLGVFQPPVGGPFIRVGSNQFSAQGALPIPVLESTIVNEAVEASNVDPVLESVRMGEVSRAYQSAANLTQRLESLQERVIRELARQSN